MRSRSEPALLGLALALAAAVTARGEEWRTFLATPDAVLCRMTPVLADEDPVVEAEQAVAREPDSDAPGRAADGGESESPGDVADSGAIVLAADESDDSKAGQPCAEENEDCRDALKKLRADRLGLIDLDIRVGGRPGNDYPCECRLEGETFEPRRFATTMFTWKAAGYCHKPLYFEDWQLERYGHSHGPLADPFFSAAHFFVTLPVLPYKMGVELPWECVYPLGYYRPGSCAPWTVPAIPISLRGMAVEAATVTGLVFLLP